MRVAVGGAIHDLLNAGVLVAELGVAEGREVTGGSVFGGHLLPDRRPKTMVSSSELAPRRLPPCREMQAVSPAA